MSVVNFQQQSFFIEKTVLIIAMFFVSISIVFTQDAYKQNGAYSLSSKLKGEATYRYTFEGNKQVKNGNFSFAYQENDSIKTSFKEKYQLKGAFKDGLESGRWYFSYTSLKPENEGVVDGLLIK